MYNLIKGTNRNTTALKRFWAILNYENQKELLEKEDAECAFHYSMNDVDYYPIDTRFCIVFTRECGYALLEASGTKIIRSIEAGDMGKMGLNDLIKDQL